MNFATGQIEERCDPWGFHSGDSFHPELVPQLLEKYLDLPKRDVSRIAEVPKIDLEQIDDLPPLVLQRFEEIAQTMTDVANFFGGDIVRAAQWFKTRNPRLGDISPRDMIRMGKADRLRLFIVSSMSENVPRRASGKAASIASG
ncbi:MAG: DUF2384 domain-containing protein [Xanthomonadales bacterium]|nr:DUF2384 domain-containing protein [Xanthomonadales bacterium]